MRKGFGVAAIGARSLKLYNQDEHRISGPANYNSQAPWPRPSWVAPPCLLAPPPPSDQQGVRPTSQLPRAARACPVWAQPRLWERRGRAGSQARSRRTKPRWASSRAGAAAAGLRGRCGPRQTGCRVACMSGPERQGPGGNRELSGQSWLVRFWRGLRQGPRPKGPGREGWRGQALRRAAPKARSS